MKLNLRTKEGIDLLVYSIYEKACDIIAREPLMPVGYLILDRQKGSEIMPVPLTAMAGNDLSQCPRLLARLSEPKAVLCSILASEVWMVMSQDPEAETRPSLHPDRKTGLMIVIKDKVLGNWAWYALVDDTFPPRKVGELQEAEGGVQGRMS